MTTATNTMNCEHAYMTEGARFPFCKGCGHTPLVRKLDEALASLNLSPKDVCLVTDIGCIGLIDSLFDKVHTVHTTHGRSTAFATGIALADKVLAEKRLKTIVLIGDGGAMIGLLHIVNAALLNSDVTVILANNFVFGMTGGQQSSFSPIDFITQTTPTGNIVPPLDICKVAVSSKAEFVVRKTTSDKDLTAHIAKAIEHPGFSIVEVLELCTEYAVEPNDLKMAELTKISNEHGHELGTLKESRVRREFGAAYREDVLARSKKSGIFGGFIPSAGGHSLTKQLSVILAGSAGERVQSSAAMLCQAAVGAGLCTSQKNDNPVTQGTGFSLSEIIISPEEINFTGIEAPDALLIVSQDGFNEVMTQKVLERVTENTLLIIDESIADARVPGGALRLSFRKVCAAPRAALGAIDYLVARLKPFPHELFRAVIEKRYGDYGSLYKSDMLREFGVK